MITSRHNRPDATTPCALMTPAGRRQNAQGLDRQVQERGHQTVVRPQENLEVTVRVSASVRSNCRCVVVEGGRILQKNNI
jgi:hypothetical protein